MTRMVPKRHCTKAALFVLAGVLLLSPVPAIGQGGPAGKDPCSSLSESELHGIFDKLAPGGVPILSHRKSPLDGLCEIAIGSAMNPQIVYLDYGRKFIIAGSLFDSRTMLNLSVAARQEIQDRFRIDVSKIPLDNALLLGEAKAEKKVIVFTDPNCPFCAALHGTLHQVVAKRKDVAFQIKLLPLPMYKDSYWKVRSIVCNRSLKMLEDAFEKKEIPRTECQTDEPDKNLQLAQSLEISATPTMIFPDGSVLVGAPSEEDLAKRLNALK